MLSQNSHKSLDLDLTRVDACRGSQVFEDVAPDQPETDAVWRPLSHVAGDKHAAGEAQYIDDMPKFQGKCLHPLMLEP